MSKQFNSNPLISSCTEPALNKLLNRFQDNELDNVSSLRVSTHLNECLFCSRQLQELEAVTSDMRQMMAIEVDAGFNARLMGQVKHAEEHRGFFFELPSVFYSLVFLIFLSLGLYINGFMVNDITVTEPTEVLAVSAGQDYQIAGMLAESRQLSLIDVQDQTIELFDNVQKAREAGNEQ